MSTASRIIVSSLVATVIGCGSDTRDIDLDGVADATSDDDTASADIATDATTSDPDAAAPDATAHDVILSDSSNDIGGDTATTTTPDTTTAPDTAADADVAIPEAAMRLHMLDVGQGDALIVEFPCGAMLVDTGGELTPGEGALGFDSDVALEAQVRAFFATRPDLHASFDLVVLTHPHIDHTRGVTRLLQMVTAGELTIRNVVTNGDESGFDSGIDEQRALHDFADGDATVGRWYVLQRKTGTTGVTNEVIDPFPACAAGGGLDPVITALWGQIDDESPLSQTWDPDDLGNANNHSVVLRVQLGAASMLLTGDLEEAGIGAMIAQYAGTGLLDVDLYKVGHHGSYNGTTGALVDAMSPQVAMISCGPPERVGEFSAWAFGHPRWRAVSDLVGDADSGGVSGTRPTAIDALVATSYQDGHGVFESRHIARAVYCTGWERHDVVVTLHSDGRIDLP